MNLKTCHNNFSNWFCISQVFSYFLTFFTRGQQHWLPGQCTLYVFQAESEDIKAIKLKAAVFFGKRLLICKQPLEHLCCTKFIELIECCTKREGTLFRVLHLVISSFEHYSQATRKLSDFYWQFLPYNSTKVLLGSILNHTWSMIMVDLCDTDKSWKTGGIAKYKIWNTKYKARQSRLCEFVIVIEIITCSVFLVYFFGMLSDFSE